MPAWVPITLADLNTAKAAALVEQFGEAALGEGQANPLPEIIAGVVARIRTEIKGCKTNQLDADTTTIPADLRSLACRMVVREAQSRLNVLGALKLSDDEREEQRNDLSYLARIARCEVPVATPGNPVAGAVQAGSNSPRITPPRRRHGRNLEDGL